MSLNLSQKRLQEILVNKMATLPNETIIKFINDLVQILYLYMIHRITCIYIFVSLLSLSPNMLQYLTTGLGIWAEF